MKSRQAQRIYEALFGGTVPEVLVQRFSVAAGRVERRFPNNSVDQLHRMLQKNYDLEAVAFAGRFAGKAKLLNLQLQLMAYLAETLPDHQKYFIPEKSGTGKALWAIGINGMRSAWLFLKGLLLLWVIRND